MRRIVTLCYLMLLAVTLRAENVALQWDHSPSAGVTGYKVYYGQVSRTYGTPDVVGYVTTHTVLNLPAGTWYFAATAYDAAGNESGYSNEVFKTLTAAMLPVTIQITEIPAPGPRITLLLVPYLSTTQATIVWQTSAECSGTAFVSTDQITWRSVKSNNLGTYDHLSAIGSLLPRTHYFYKVTGVCGTQSIESSVRSFNTK